jgi:hypothetical protein
MNVFVRIGATAAVLSLSLGGIMAPAAAGAGTVLARAGAVPVAYDCHGWHRGQVRPHMFLLDCGFENVFLAGGDKFKDQMKWTWQADHAYSRAVLWVNKCKPNCAAGHYAKYPARLTLWRPETRHAVRYFSRMTLRYRHGHNRTYHFKWYTGKGAKTPVWHGGPS